MKPDDALTVEEIRSGIAGTIECRRIAGWHAVKVGAFMAGCSLLVIGAGYLVQGRVSPWVVVLPAALVLAGTFELLGHFRRLSRLVRELEEAERKVVSGGIVRAKEIPSLGLHQAA